MKIFNLKPITVKEYIFNEEYLKESQRSSHLESGFYFECKVINALKTMIVGFDILYTVGGEESYEEVIASANPYEQTITVTNVYEEGAGEILLSYKSACSFNLENEGFDTDILSLTTFLSDYNLHTQTFLNSYKPDLLRLEEELFSSATLKSNALCAIENLKGNNMYEF